MRWSMETVAPFSLLFSLGQTKHKDSCGARAPCYLACICVARKHHNRSLVCVISGIRQAAEPLCDRVGVPDLGHAPAEDHEIQEVVPLAPGACHVGVGSPQGQRQRQDGHQASHPQSGVSVHTQ